MAIHGMALLGKERLGKGATHERPPRPVDLAWALTLDSLLFQAEAEVRWLDHVEASLARHAPPPCAARPPAAAAPEAATEAGRS